MPCDVALWESVIAILAEPVKIENHSFEHVVMCDECSMLHFPSYRSLNGKLKFLLKLLKCFVGLLENKFGMLPLLEEIL